MGFLTDMTQSDDISSLKNTISRLETRIRKLEKNNDGGTDMSRIIKDLVGCDIIVGSDEIFDEKCRVLEVDDYWIKLLAYGKKGDTTKIIRVDNITSIELC